ncbi:UNVERIFIED_CONTAM: hypothetical protein GTU68_062587 [Idotea baltica]|nr:hypothetical protein [Idotea baltica]
MNKIEEKIYQSIRQVPDFPKKGINFYDITTLLSNQELFNQTILLLSNQVKKSKPDIVIGVESRGFIFASAIAFYLKLPLAIIRKKGKLPFQTITRSYDLEYGEGNLELHTDSIRDKQKVSIIDDVLATGGTINACEKLVQDLGGEVIQNIFLLEIEGLNPRKVISCENTFSLLKV